MITHFIARRLLKRAGFSITHFFNLYIIVCRGIRSVVAMTVLAGNQPMKPRRHLTANGKTSKRRHMASLSLA